MRGLEGGIWKSTIFTDDNSPGAYPYPEQELYEQIRPIVLFHETAGERAKEINAAQRTLSRKADEFERYGTH